MLFATTAGSARPVDAATQAAMQSGHFGSKVANTPGITPPAAFNQRRPGLLSGAVPRSSQQRHAFTAAPSNDSRRRWNAQPRFRGSDRDDEPRP